MRRGIRYVSPRVNSGWGSLPELIRRVIAIDQAIECTAVFNADDPHARCHAVGCPFLAEGWLQRYRRIREMGPRKRDAVSQRNFPHQENSRVRNRWAAVQIKEIQTRTSHITAPRFNQTKTEAGGVGGMTVVRPVILVNI